MQNYQERSRLRMNSIRDMLVSYCGNRKRNIREVPPLAKWQTYELMKEGISPDGILFYLKIAYPTDFNSPVYVDLLTQTLQQAHEEFLTSGHFMQIIKH